MKNKIIDRKYKMKKKHIGIIKGMISKDYKFIDCYRYDDVSMNVRVELFHKKCGKITDVYLQTLKNNNGGIRCKECGESNINNSVKFREYTRGEVEYGGIIITQAIKRKLEEYRVYTLIGYDVESKELTISHKGCDKPFKISRKLFMSRVNKKGFCPTCRPKSNKVEPLIEDKYGGRFTYEGTSNHNYFLKCVKCGEVNKYTVSPIMNGNISCKCDKKDYVLTYGGSSKLETYAFYVVKNIFKNNEYAINKSVDIEYEGEVKKLKPDILLDLKYNKYHIEINGEQHYKEVELFNSTPFEERVRNDKIKKEHFEKLGYKYICVDTKRYFTDEYIMFDEVLSNILEENNIKVKNIDKILKKCFNDVFSNRCSQTQLYIMDNKKKIINMWREGASMIELGEEFGTNRQTISKFLDFWDEKGNKSIKRKVG